MSGIFDRTLSSEINLTDYNSLNLLTGKILDTPKKFITLYSDVNEWFNVFAVQADELAKIYLGNNYAKVPFESFKEDIKYVIKLGIYHCIEHWCFNRLPIEFIVSSVNEIRTGLQLDASAQSNITWKGLIPESAKNVWNSLGWIKTFYKDGDNDIIDPNNVDLSKLASQDWVLSNIKSAIDQLKINDLKKETDERKSADLTLQKNIDNLEIKENDRMDLLNKTTNDKFDASNVLLNADIVKLQSDKLDAKDRIFYKYQQVDDHGDPVGNLQDVGYTKIIKYAGLSPLSYDPNVEMVTIPVVKEVPVGQNIPLDDTPNEQGGNHAITSHWAFLHTQKNDADFQKIANTLNSLIVDSGINEDKTHAISSNWAYMINQKTISLENKTKYIDANNNATTISSQLFWNNGLNIGGINANIDSTSSNCPNVLAKIRDDQFIENNDGYRNRMWVSYHQIYTDNQQSIHLESFIKQDYDYDIQLLTSDDAIGKLSIINYKYNIRYVGVSDLYWDNKQNINCIATVLSYYDNNDITVSLTGNGGMLLIKEVWINESKSLSPKSLNNFLQNNEYNPDYGFKTIKN